MRYVFLVLALGFMVGCGPDNTVVKKDFDPSERPGVAGAEPGGSGSAAEEKENNDSAATNTVPADE